MGRSGGISSLRGGEDVVKLSRDLHEKKHKRDKEHKSSKHDKKEKKKKKKSSSSSQLKHPKITEDDYFRKNEEFKVWLKAGLAEGDDRGTFETMSGAEARQVFTEYFCKAWNKGRLPQVYYDGITAELKRSIGRPHAWGFRMTDEERDQLEDLSDQIREGNQGKGQDEGYDFSVGSSSSSSSRHVAPLVGNVSDHRIAQRQEREQRHVEQSINRSRMLTLAEEVAPRAIGGSREALLDKKRAIGECTHASHVAKHEAIEISDRDIYGEGEGSVEKEKQRLAQRHAHTSARAVEKQQANQEYIQELRERAQQQENVWKHKLGLGGIDFTKEQKRIAIQPRPSSEAAEDVPNPGQTYD